MSDVPGGERNMTGIMIAGLSVVSSGMQQIFCRTMQQKHGLASHELLANTAPAQARSPLSCGASRMVRARSYPHLCNHPPAGTLYSHSACQAWLHLCGSPAQYARSALPRVTA